MNYWIYNKKSITRLEDIPNYEDVKGFVYKITHKSTGKIYIGKKALSSSRKSRISKREKSLTSTRKVFKKTIKGSNWLEYWGSSKLLCDEIKLLGKQEYKREILEFTKTPRYLTYLELVYQIKYDVLRTDSYNGNILGRFFRKDME